MSHRLLRFTAVLLVLALNLLGLPGPPRAVADNTRAFTTGSQVMSTAADILSAIDPSQEALTRFGTGLGSAVMGISIGEAISDVYAGEVTKGLETFVWAVGETAVGLTAMGPFYALGKLAAAGSGWAVEKFYAYMTDDYYIRYKQLRCESLWPLVEAPKRDRFITWARGGRGTFDGYWPTMWADKFARDRFIDQYRAEVRAKYSWTERTVGFRLFSVGSKRAEEYFKAMNEVPDQAVLKEFIFRRWEAQVVTEALQEAAGRIRDLQAERNKGIFLVLTGQVLDAEGQTVAADRVAVATESGLIPFSAPGALAPSFLREAGGRFALAGNMAYLSGLDPNLQVSLTANGQTAVRFTLGSVLKPSLPARTEAGISYLTADLGTLRLPSAGTVLRPSVRLRGAPAEKVNVKSLDPQVTRIDDLATESAPAFRLAAVPGRSVRLLLEVWDSVSGGFRNVMTEVTIPQTPGPLPLTVDVPVLEISAAAGDDAAVAALRQNYDLLVAGRITGSIYSSARGALVSAHPSLSALADEYDRQIRALADQELQYLRVQSEYFTAKTDELKNRAARVADGVTNPIFQLVDTDQLSARAGKADQYQQARSAYANMLEQAAKYQSELEGLQAEYARALSNAAQHYELYANDLRGFTPAQYPPETNRFAANAAEIGRLLQPHLDQRTGGFLADCDKSAARYQAKTEWLQTRAAAMKTNLDGSRARIANARSAAGAVLARHQSYKEKGLFDLVWGIGSLYETMNGILFEAEKVKAGQPANTEWLNHYRNRLPEFYARASHNLEQIYPILGVTHKPVFPADTFEGFMDRMQPWMAYEARVYEEMAGPLAVSLAITEASSTMGQYSGLDFPLAGDDAWTDWYNAVPPGGPEAYKREGQEFQNLIALALENLNDPAGDATMIDKWIRYLTETGYTLKTAPATASGGTTGTGPGKIILQVGSNVAWVNGQRVELAAAVPVINGRSLVPVRMIGEALGATVVWNAEYQEVTYIKGTLTVAMRVGDSLVRVEDRTRSERFFIDPVPQLIEGRTFVPVRVVSEALGATVQWVPQTQEIIIELP